MDTYIQVTLICVFSLDWDKLEYRLSTFQLGILLKIKTSLALAEVSAGAGAVDKADYQLKQVFPL